MKLENLEKVADLKMKLEAATAALQAFEAVKADKFSAYAYSADEHGQFIRSAYRLKIPAAPRGAVLEIAKANRDSIVAELASLGVEV